MAGSALTQPRVAVAQPLWSLLRVAGRPLDVAEIAATTQADRQAIRWQLRQLEHAGLVSATPNKPRLYAMNDQESAGPTPPAFPDGRPPRPSVAQRIWKAMRKLRRFDEVFLCQAADVPGVTARTYLNRLMRAGYVQQLRRRNKRTGELGLYALVRDTGPRAPVVERGRVDGRFTLTLADPNSGQRIDVSPGVVSLRAAL